MINIDKLERLEQEATPGDWRAADDWSVRDADGNYLLVENSMHVDGAPDVAFVVELRNAATALIAAARRAEVAEARIANLREKLELIAGGTIMPILTAKSALWVDDKAARGEWDYVNRAPAHKEHCNGK